MTKPALELINVTKIFQKERESVRAVNGVNLTVAQGEMVVFLGPSGCGKTTTLRMIAGFELPSSGQILIDGADMTNTPVNRRGIGFVFQNYALFPHMNVFNNVAYGLKSRGEADNEIRKKVKNGLALVGLSNAESRYPNQLSGGEQQRVALARVLVMEPKLLLMDEPLSNLDAKLRVYMRTEIRKIQKQLGITCLYVTHDQAEALTMADRVMVMNTGSVEQIGSPFDLYASPQSLFVADFIGQANILSVPVFRVDTNAVQVLLHGEHAVSIKAPSYEKITAGEKASLVVRPEHVRVLAKDEEKIDIQGHQQKDGILRTCIPARVINALFMGGHIEYHLDAGEHGHILSFEPFRPEMHRFEEGQEVFASIDPDMALVLAAE